MSNKAAVLAHFHLASVTMLLCHEAGAEKESWCQKAPESWHGRLMGRTPEPHIKRTTGICNR